MKVGYNDHLVVGIKIYTWKWFYDDSGPKPLNMYKKHDVQVTIKALGPLLRLQAYLH